jgi:hypothetical protein
MRLVVSCGETLMHRLRGVLLHGTAVVSLNDLLEDAEAEHDVMSDNEVCKIIDKLQKLRALSRARERVRQLERELYGEGAKAQEPPHLPEFLSQHSALRIV